MRRSRTVQHARRANLDLALRGCAVDVEGHAIDAAQQGRLARAGGTNDRGQRASRDLQRHIVQRCDLAMVNRELADRYPVARALLDAGCDVLLPIHPRLLGLATR